MDEALRHFVRERANHRCEYCHLPQDAEPFFAYHVEHIVARQHGGGKESIAAVEWRELKPDAKNTWLTTDTAEEFAKLIPMGSPEMKQNATIDAPVVFRTYTPGVNTARDFIAYDFNEEKLRSRIELFFDSYNGELDRWRRKGCPGDIDNFVSYERIKWSETLKRRLAAGEEAVIEEHSFCSCLYRPLQGAPFIAARMP
jgi:predicted helicase